MADGNRGHHLLLPAGLDQVAAVGSEVGWCNATALPSQMIASRSSTDPTLLMCALPRQSTS